MNPIATDNMPVCGWRHEHADYITLRSADEISVQDFLGDASELFENLEEIFPRYLKWFKKMAIWQNLSSLKG